MLLPAIGIAMIPIASIVIARFSVHARAELWGSFFACFGGAAGVTAVLMSWAIWNGLRHKGSTTRARAAKWVPLASVFGVVLSQALPDREKVFALGVLGGFMTVSMMCVSYFVVRSALDAGKERT